MKKDLLWIADKFWQRSWQVLIQKDLLRLMILSAIESASDGLPRDLLRLMILSEKKDLSVSSSEDL